MNDGSSSQREVELRFEIDESVWGELRRVLFDAESPSVSRQDDLYFDRSDCSYVARLPVRQWVRLRDEDGRCEINRKVFHYPEGSDVATHAEEFSFTFSTRADAIAVLDTLGFTELVRVRKTRYRYVSIAGVEVAFDHVDDLGWFVEIESLERTEPLQTVTAALERVAERLDLPLTEQDRRGYPFMLLERAGRIGT